MAIKEMQKIGEYAVEHYKLSGISLYHRVGEVVSTVLALTTSTIAYRGSFSEYIGSLGPPKGSD